MLQLMENIETADNNANIVYINMEVSDFSHIKNMKIYLLILKTNFHQIKTTISLLMRFKK